MPKRLTNDDKTYEFINTLWATYDNITDKKIILDCSRTIEISLNIMAPLGLVLTKMKSNRNTILLRALNKDMRRKLISAGFLEKLEDNDDDVKQNYIKYKTFSGDDNDRFGKYILQQLRPIKDSDIINILISHIMEVFVNIKMHARIKGKSRYRTKEVFSGGEYYKSQNYSIISVANNGLTLKENINGLLHIDLDKEVDYITWALQKSNSTRKTKSEGPGGLGLFLLVELIKKCKGVLIISSGKGFYKLDANRSRNNINKDFACPFPGTVITVKVPINDIVLSNVKVNNDKIFDINDLLEGDNICV